MGNLLFFPWTCQSISDCRWSVVRYTVGLVWVQELILFKSLLMAVIRFNNATMAVTKSIPVIKSSLGVDDCFIHDSLCRYFIERLSSNSICYYILLFHYSFLNVVIWKLEDTFFCYNVIPRCKITILIVYLDFRVFK